MTTVAIMQPTYLPWAGYFALIDAVDKFVLLDNVPINRKSWQTRNRIRARDGNVVWLSVPTNARRGDLICDVEIRWEHPWRAKHYRSLLSAYGHTLGWPQLDGFFNPDDDDLMEWPLSTFHDLMIADLCTLVGIPEAKVVSADDLISEEMDPDYVRHDRIGRILDLCELLKADTLVDVRGATFLDGADLEGISLEWFDYTPVPYEQGGQEWMSHLSVIDMIAHHGPDSLDIIRAGHT